jgi:hypothetical protein
MWLFQDSGSSHQIEPIEATYRDIHRSFRVHVEIKDGVTFLAHGLAGCLAFRFLSLG